MAYVAVKGGEAAIAESIKRLRYERLRERRTIAVKAIRSGLRALVDRVMSEASLYAKELAALAIKQAEGNPEEATFLLRAYRSTLPRKYYSRLTSMGSMFVERRISAAFKDIAGGQLLGASADYTHRLLDFNLEKETSANVRAWLAAFQREQEAEKPSVMPRVELPRVTDILRSEGLLRHMQQDDTAPRDITRQSMTFPAERSERLQTLTRGESGAVVALGYAAIRGYGLAAHPTVAALVVGRVAITIDYPLGACDSDDEALYLGQVRVTEVDAIIPAAKKGQGDKQEIEIRLGYGLCFGQNESKAIAMSVLDYCLEHPIPDSPVHDEEFVLTHIDSVEASGFISHLKLPHYVTFQSELDAARRINRGER
ncbi:MAG: Alpha-D-ribose 1-methylphosphonate 5-triphosphate synthase subunit PhnI [Firmicutes bacterium]|nr:Alpha-D-ribose 1-methylphosphonate 5-triphosphate synthase subunit PhnI [Bacillota bacterium]MBT9152109.1 Alpha-D-ribose 1-methylphosphonate 5-triphosphate synthase subunit PhnI [Bacillota bacterium]